MEKPQVLKHGFPKSDLKCFQVKYGIRGTFYCHKISKKYTAYEALESMKRWIQGKKLGPSTIETVLFTKYSLFTHSKKPKME